jgi:hypothetical protein
MSVVEKQDEENSGKTRQESGSISPALPRSKNASFVSNGSTTVDFYDLYAPHPFVIPQIDSRRSVSELRATMDKLRAEMDETRAVGNTTDKVNNIELNEITTAWQLMQEKAMKLKDQLEREKQTLVAEKTHLEEEKKVPAVFLPHPLLHFPSF